MKEQLRVLNENLRRETEQLLFRDKELATLNNDNKMLRERLEEIRNDTSQVKDEQARLIENLRLQLNETREQIVQMKEDKQKEFKKIKERHEDQRRRETDQHAFELDKVRNEMALAQKRLGQEEHFSKELAIINNKLQGNLIRPQTSGPRQSVQEDNFSDSDEGSTELIKRK